MKARFDAITKMGCIVCRIKTGFITPGSIHHLTGLKYRATGKKADDKHTICLCHFHHQGAHGIHHLGARRWEKMFGEQTWLLAVSNEILAGRH